jgi:hypothetical protein
MSSAYFCVQSNNRSTYCCIDNAKARGEIFELIKRINDIKQSPIKSLTAQQVAVTPIDMISIQGEKPKASKSTPTVTVYDLFIEKSTVPDGTDESVDIRSPLTVRMMHMIRTTLPYILGNNTQPFPTTYTPAYLEVYRSFKSMMDSKHHLGKIKEYNNLTAPLFLDMKRDGDRSQVMAFYQLWKDYGEKGKIRKDYPNMLFVSHDRLCCTQMCLEGGPVTMYFSAGGNYKLVRCDPNGCPQSGGGTLSEEKESNCMQHPTLRDMLDVIAMKTSQLIEVFRSEQFKNAPITDHQKNKLFVDLFREIVEYIRSIPSINIQEDEKVIEPFFDKLTHIYDNKTESLYLYIFDRLDIYYSYLPYIKDKIEL